MKEFPSSPTTDWVAVRPDVDAVRASVVIPAFNEASRLPAVLTALTDELLEEHQCAVELLVVDDGSREADRAQVSQAVEQQARRLSSIGLSHRLRFIQCPKNRGKAMAIRTGWNEAHPETNWFGFLDADGAIGPSEFLRLIRLLTVAHYDVVCGSRVKLAGRDIHRSTLRHWQGRVFGTIADGVFELGIYDTQCGVKFFRSLWIKPLLSRLTEERWLLDLELLALLKREGARIVEVPINWSDPGGSKVRPGVDAARMLAGIFRIKRTHRL